jgi:hypothetical protein
MGKKTQNNIMEQTLRDKFAASVISDIIRNNKQSKMYYRGCENLLDDDCRMAYNIADAMIKARK